MKRFPFGVLVLLFSGQFTFANDGVFEHRLFRVDTRQLPPQLQKYPAKSACLLYAGPLGYLSHAKGFYDKDSIQNLKAFLDSTKSASKKFRLIFRSDSKIDSVYEFGVDYNLYSKVYMISRVSLVRYQLNDIGAVIAKYEYNYGNVISKLTNYRITAEELVYSEDFYWKLYDYKRSNHVWILSVGIDDYGERKYANCKSDAIGFARFFKSQFLKQAIGDTSWVHEYVLLDSQATRANILKSLKDIASRSAVDDYFIFNFTGQSNLFTIDSINFSTYFFPYDVEGDLEHPVIRGRKSTANVFDSMISLKLLQEYVQQIPANNQLFVTEAGPSEKFKSEFIRTLMQNSIEVASLLNKNRVIIVPNRFGMDGVVCDSVIQKGPINFYIRSLPDKYNIYDLFADDVSAGKVAFAIKSKAYECNSFSYEYFDVFFERKFLKEYREMLGNTGGEQTRGLKAKSAEVQKEINELTAGHYALIVGTDHYKGGWDELKNPIADARAIGNVLRDNYGFEVQVLEDKPMDSIYMAIGEYYNKLQPNDQFILYFAGHGAKEESFLSDGFIVCTDSKPIEQDIARNTYISYAKLQRMLNNIPARQILVLLDVCHGGLFDPKVFDRKREDTKNVITNRNVLQYLRDKLPLRTRKFLSSVSTESALDGAAGRHSPFANLMLQILTNQADNKDGIIFLSDIFAVLQKQSLNETTDYRIYPVVNDFGTVDAFSEFVFISGERKE